jgi:hypothetical protein
MNVNLRIVSGFVAAEVSPEEHAAHNYRQHEHEDQYVCAAP